MILPVPHPVILHRSITILAGLLLLVSGPRLYAQHEPIAFEAAWVIDGSKNFRGGANTQGGTLRHLFSANLTLDGEPLFAIPGATVFIDFQTQNGDDGSGDTGDLQAYSNIDAADFTAALYELWYEQIWDDGTVRVKIGKVDANSEFAYVDHGGAFLNSSAGFSPTILGYPTYPDPATSFNLFIEAAEQVTLGFGVYDGATQHGTPTGTRGPSTFLGSPSDLFFIGEAAVTWDGGRAAIGGWGHTGDFTRFDGGTDSGAQGFYLTCEHTLWRADPDAEHDTRGIGAFFQFGWADQDVAAIKQHLGIGLQWTGPIASRPNDVCGIMITRVELSDEPGAGFTENHETATELFYLFELNENLSLQPDLQFISHPGGAGLSDALVGTLRVTLTY